MYKKVFISSLLFMVVFGASLAFAAKPNTEKQQVVVNASNGNANGNAKVSIPARAVEVSPGVFSLGTAIDNGVKVEGYAFVRYKDGYARPGTQCGNNVCEAGENAKKCPSDCGGSDPAPTDNSCYSFLAKNAKWKSVEPYVVNPANTENLDEVFVFDNFVSDVQKWNQAAGAEILGSGSNTTNVLVLDTSSPDGVNEVYFGTIDEPGAIAITTVWGVFGGAPRNRVLVEWDQIYDQVDFDWSAGGEIGKMDFENIVTHELGHSVGLGDLYTTECSEQTMYGYATEGEVKKHSLEPGDITGLNKLY